MFVVAEKDVLRGSCWDDLTAASMVGPSVAQLVDERAVPRAVWRARSLGKK